MQYNTRLAYIVGWIGNELAIKAVILLRDCYRLRWSKRCTIVVLIAIIAYIKILQGLCHSEKSLSNDK